MFLITEASSARLLRPSYNPRDLVKRLSSSIFQETSWLSWTYRGYSENDYFLLWMFSGGVHISEKLYSSVLRENVNVSCVVQWQSSPPQRLQFLCHVVCGQLCALVQAQQCSILGQLWFGFCLSLCVCVCGSGGVHLIHLIGSFWNRHCRSRRGQSCPWS